MDVWSYRYFFSITKYDPKVKNPLFLIYGDEDTWRPWKVVKTSYYGRLAEENIVMIKGMGH